MKIMNEEIENIKKWIGDNLSDAKSNDWFEPDNFMTKIQPILPNCLQVVALPPTWSEGKYNCFVYAFGLHNEPLFLRKTKRPSSSDLENIVLLNSSQVSSLLSLCEETSEPTVGDYVIYKDKIITHAGIYYGNDIVESKWSDGPILRHNIYAVHPGYGNDVFFYKKRNYQEVKDFFISLDREYKKPRS